MSRGFMHHPFDVKIRRDFRNLTKVWSFFFLVNPFYGFTYKKIKEHKYFSLSSNHWVNSQEQKNLTFVPYHGGFESEFTCNFLTCYTQYRFTRNDVKFLLARFCLLTWNPNLKWPQKIDLHDLKLVVSKSPFFTFEVF